MTSFHQKNQILESLDSLDHGQTEKVLEYIRTLAHTQERRICSPKIET